MLHSSSHAVCGVDIWRLRRSTPLDGAVQGGNESDCTVVEPQALTPSFGDHVAGANLKGVAGRTSRSVEQEPGHRRWAPS